MLLVALGAALWGTDGVLRVPLLREMSPVAIVLGEHLILLLYSVPAVAGKASSASVACEARVEERPR